jgi:hypothetical protein
MNKLLMIFILCFMIACSSEKTSDTGWQRMSEESDKSISETPQIHTAVEGSLSAEIGPLEATRNSTLNLTLKDADYQEAKIEWLVNGKPVDTQSIPNQFKTADTRRGDMVQAKLIIGEKEILSNAVMIKNTPPELSKVKIMPEIFKPGDRLYVDASGSDIDGDDVTLEFEWTINGEPAGSERKIGNQVKRGDRISVKISPFDGESYGDSINLYREMRNMPPVIAEDKEFTFDSNIYTYHVKASDPDGDDLTYSFKTAPEGMTIDSSGLITWSVPPDFNGKAPVTVSVSDGNGGEATSNFNVEIHTEKR